MGVNVVIHEMRPKVETFAHQTGNLAEMVCSNSSDRMMMSRTQWAFCMKCARPMV